MDLSVVIPAYNEQERLTPTLLDLARELRSGRRTFEIVVVDDGSTDGTVALCRDLGMPELRVIATRPNRGQGSAVRVGMLAARGAVRVQWDADGSTPARELGKLLQPIERGKATVSIGSRYVDGAAPHGEPRYRIAWSRFGNAVFQRVFLPGILDTQCGFKAYTAAAALDVFSRARIDGWTFDVEALALAVSLGHDIVEVGVEWRHDERSRASPLRDAVRMVAETIVLWRDLRQGRYDLPV